LLAAGGGCAVLRVTWRSISRSPGRRRRDRSPVVPVSRCWTPRWTGIAAAAASAVPLGHVDFGLWSGVDRFEYWGSCWQAKAPVVRSSAKRRASCVTRAAAILGALVVTDMPASGWWAGDAWIPELFVVSGHQGQGLGAFWSGMPYRPASTPVTGGSD